MKPAHRAALGAVLADPRLAGQLTDQLTADDFDPGWYQLAYTAIHDLHAEGATADTEAVVGRLQRLGLIHSTDGDIGPFLAELYESATYPLELERHIAGVIEDSYRRQVWAATTRIRQACTEWSLAALRQTVDSALTNAMVAASRLQEPKATARTVAGIPGLSEILGESPAA